MRSKTVRKPYRKPIVQKQRRLADVTESDTLITSGPTGVKGGCFSNNR